MGASGYGRCGGYEGFKAFSNRKGLLLKGHATPAFVLDMLSPPYRKASMLFSVMPYLSGLTQQKLLVYLAVFALTITGLIFAAVYYFRSGTNGVSDL